MIKTLYYLSDSLLVYPFAATVLVSLYFTLKSGFIQLRTLPLVCKMLWYNKSHLASGMEEHTTVSPRTALFVAMATSIGMGNIAGPIMAVGMGGPGALFGFMLASLLGAATIFYEVFFAIKCRKELASGDFAGGAMQYLQEGISLKTAVVYAFLTLIMLTAWTASQANNVAILLQASGIPNLLTGCVLAVLTLIILVGGIERVGKVCDKMLPIMFVLYCLTTITIISRHLDQLPKALSLIFNIFSFQGAAGMVGGYTFSSMARWGFARAVHACEMGVGTSAIPHSATRNHNAESQGAIAMVSVYANVFLTMLTGLTILVTGAWMQPGAKFDVSMFYYILDAQFPLIGPKILVVCCILFGFSTVLGNSYNASRCFAYLWRNVSLLPFYVLTCLAIVVGSVLHVKLAWTIVDFLSLPVLLVNLPSLIYLVYTNFKIKPYKE